jgi:gliding motility-associatede transport system auxiliary component
MLNRIAGIVGWIGTALVVVAVAIRAIRLFRPDLLRPEYEHYAYWFALAGLACVIVYILGQWRDVATAMSRKQTRLGTIALAGVLIVLGLLIAVNYLASRRNHRWDLTANQQFSLSPQTRQILEKLDSPVTVLVFDRPAEFDRFRDRLNEYQYTSKKVSVEYLDPDKQPVRANQNQVQAYGTVVFGYKGRTERVISSDEQALTNGLIKLITGSERKVYFLQGHGEKETGDSEREGYSAVASALGSENFKVEPLSLAQQQTVPADATVVVVAGPKTDLFPPEVSALRTYLSKGGKLLVMIDPPDKANSQPFTNLTALAKEWGIDVGNNVVVDVSGIGRLIGTDEFMPVAAPPYPAHPITDRFKLITAYRLARSVAAATTPPTGKSAQSFIQTSANSWAETDLAGLFTGKTAENNKDRDVQGPVSLGAAVTEEIKDANAATPKKDGEESKKLEARVVVVGDSDFVTNSLLGVQGNRDLFLNTLNWLSQQENLISIRPKDPDDRRITLTAGQQWWVKLLALLVLPAAIFGAGIFNWSRRRG